jgi:hypothetical protein
MGWEFIHLVCSSTKVILTVPREGHKFPLLILINDKYHSISLSLFKINV